MNGRVAVLCLLLGAGCAPGARAAPRGATEPSPTQASRKAQESEPPADAAYEGSIDRSGLVSLIDQGLGRLLSLIQLEPTLAQGQFGGFRVESVHPDWQHAGLRTGDVILRVNGQAIERPDQAVAVYESLRTASEVRLRLLRDGQPAELRFQIQ